MDTIWPPSYGQARFAAEAGGSSGMKIKYFGSVFLDQIMRYNTWLEKHFFSFSLKESSNTLTHKDYTANCSSSKLIVSKRSFSRNFFHHQTSPVKLVYFFFLFGFLSRFRLRNHGGYFAGDFIQLGLDFVQYGIDLGFVVQVNLKKVKYSFLKKMSKDEVLIYKNFWLYYDKFKKKITKESVYLFWP